MSSLLQPDPEGLLLVRTYFGSDGDWDAFVREATATYDPRGFAAFFYRKESLDATVPLRNH